MSFLVDLAAGIAREAHRGQLYGGKEDYFEAHVEKVAERVRNAGYSDKHIAVAYLHDVVEDTEITLQELYDAGMPPEVVMSVEAMTHREGESYMAYLWRASENKFARVVKYHDMKQNLSCNPTARQTVKYTMGIDFLSLRFPHEGFDNAGTI